MQGHNHSTGGALVAVRPAPLLSAAAATRHLANKSANYKKLSSIEDRDQTDRVTTPSAILEFLKV